jgi:predicted metal-dependent RNase
MHEKPKKIFITHGEPEQGQLLGQKIKQTYSIDTVQPQFGQSFEL